MMHNSAQTLRYNPPSVTASALSQMDVLIRELDGNPKNLFDEAGVPFDALVHPETTVPFESYVDLLELSASRLSCPQFGLRLAKLHGGRPTLGPLDIAMQHSRTLGEAYELCAVFSPAFSMAIRLTLGHTPCGKRSFIRYDIRSRSEKSFNQLIEYVIAWVHVSVLRLSRNGARPAEIWLAHEQLAPSRAYSSFFGTKVSFGKPMNAVFISKSHMQMPLSDRDTTLYDIAKNYIESHYPSTMGSIQLLVRNAIQTLLGERGCTYLDVARVLGLHPRVLQRRLYSEGITFEKLKDDVRRQIAVRLLAQKSVPLAEVASALDYSEVAVLCRSCRRWFCQTPRKIRFSSNPSDYQLPAESHLA